MHSMMFTFEDGSQALSHHGIKGMKWGVRRFQNPDGSLTSAGKQRYLEIGKKDLSLTKETKRDYNNMSNREFRKKYSLSKGAYAKRVERSITGDPFAEGRKRMRSTESGRKMYDISAQREAKARAIGSFNAKADKLMSTRTTGEKIVDTLLLGGKHNQRAYYKLKSTNASNGQIAVTMLLGGGRAADYAANRRYLDSSAGKKSYKRQLARYYE